jgi:hypothetical protein
VATAASVAAAAVLREALTGAEKRESQGDAWYAHR